MAPIPIVLDTNILVAALRSRRGASFKLLSLVGRTDAFTPVLSVPLVLEYEEVLKRPGNAPGLNHADIDAILDYLCAVGQRRDIFFLWRPALKDPWDDMLLELAVEAGAPVIVTFNLRDFKGIERFGVRAIPPQAFLKEVGAL